MSLLTSSHPTHNLREIVRLIAWSAIIVVATIYILMQYGAAMDVFEISILVSSSLSIGYMGWKDKQMMQYIVSCALLAFAGIYLYQGQLNTAENSFFLRYFLSSQSAIMWMSALFVLSSACYLIGLLRNNSFLDKTAIAFMWCGAAMGLIGLLVRWHESYLIDPQIGYIPVSNLYEVFILFCQITALIYLYYQRQYQTTRLGFFVSLIISCAVAFLLWYTFERQAHTIRPLVPALNSYWMKIHVPANFIGYGCFAISAMVASAWLTVHAVEKKNPNSHWLNHLPDQRLMEDVMYRSIALGFAFFTIATVLGALWAAEAWGSYWSWDPKETWALIVWLNYAGWLHLRLSKGLRGTVMAWWAIIGLFVTLFAFIGVNMFLSGLHSYGEL